MSDPIQQNLFVFNFPPVPHVYSVCPFGIKLESFLRINNIPHKLIYTTNFSSKGQMPYVRFGDSENGEEVPDSNVVIARLLKEQKVTCTDHALSPYDRAISHTIIRMLEEHTTQIGFYYRYGLDVQSFVDVLEIGDRFGNPEIRDRFLKYQPGSTLEKTQKRGLSRHPPELLWDFSNDDIQALSDLLGDKKYFLGNSVPTLADCAVFGHLSQFLWIPIDFPQQSYIKEKCPNLVQFMENFRNEHWPDWDECCKKQPNAKYAAAAENKKEEAADEKNQQ